MGLHEIPTADPSFTPQYAHKPIISPPGNTTTYHTRRIKKKKSNYHCKKKITFYQNMASIDSEQGFFFFFFMTSWQQAQKELPPFWLFPLILCACVLPFILRAVTPDTILPSCCRTLWRFIQIKFHFFSWQVCPLPTLRPPPAPSLLTAS